MSTKKCPFCAEDINVDAKKCKHCGEYLDDNLKQEKASTSQKVVVEQKSSGLVTFLVILGIIALLLFIFGV